METLKKRISNDYMEAFRNKEGLKKNLLGVVKAEITTQEKNINVSDLSDEDVMKILSKVAKNLKETIDKSGSEEAKNELTIVEAYLPKQMSEDEIRSAVSIVITELGATSPSDMGKVMGAFKTKYSGSADNKIVSSVVKELLTVKK